MWGWERGQGLVLELGASRSETTRAGTLYSVVICLNLALSRALAKAAARETRGGTTTSPSSPNLDTNYTLRGAKSSLSVSAPMVPGKTHLSQKLVEIGDASASVRPWNPEGVLTEVAVLGITIPSRPLA